MKHETFELDLPSIGTNGRRSLFNAYQSRPKRRLDLVLLVCFAPIVLPLIAILWTLIRLDGGAGFFGHQRIGRGGQPFICWKLRSMRPDAENLLKSHLAENRDAALEWASAYKLQNDPRVTRLGRVLRKTSLDELPQFWNVLLGEMSFVGPRPVPPAELVEYAGYEWAYLNCRPGITGLWQVSGRNAVSYTERVRMDVAYNLKASFRTDIAIILRTFWVVIRRTGI